MHQLVRAPCLLGARFIKRLELANTCLAKGGLANSGRARDEEVGSLPGNSSRKMNPPLRPKELPIVSQSPLGTTALSHEIVASACFVCPIPQTQTHFARGCSPLLLFAPKRPFGCAWQRLLASSRTFVLLQGWMRCWRLGR